MWNEWWNVLDFSESWLALRYAHAGSHSSALVSYLILFFFKFSQIPNPLFDLAGITCGHFLVPFWTFFGATLIGKAIINTHLQQLTVIVAFNENLVSKLVTALAKVFPSTFC